MLTLEDPHRFRKSRDVGCYVGLQPGRRTKGFGPAAESSTRTELNERKLL
jgi:hypothetical protein